MTDDPIRYQAPNGPHPVGVRDGEVLDRAYPTLRPDDADGRRLMVRVWYPAAAAHGQPRAYAAGPERQVLAWFIEATSGFIPQAWVHRLADVRTHSLPGAAVAEGAFPTLVFSHGAHSYVCQNTPLMEELASRGYVVWSIAHPGEAGGVAYPDGTLVRYDEAFHAAALGLNAGGAYHAKFVGEPAQRFAATGKFLDGFGLGPWSRRWVDDKRAVIDALERQSVTGAASSVTAACDLSRIGLFGMSFGGAAAVSAAHQDHRVAAAVNIDGGQFLSDLLDTDVRVPMLQLSADLPAQLRASGLEPTAVDANEFFFEPLASAGTRPDVQRLRINGVTHLELTDMALIPAADRAAALPVSGSLSSERIVDLLDSFVGAYFDTILRGADVGYPTAQLRQFTEAKPIDMSSIRSYGQAQPLGMETP
ncbi:MAG: hypothetical protein JOZ47_21210 [Kutzneria sp.]|nr:hypothetical protein [Kutzneria sp.]MBV9847566.1 hypothetical protein [Kutzneria sp.]